MLQHYEPPVPVTNLLSRFQKFSPCYFCDNELSCFKHFSFLVRMFIVKHSQKALGDIAGRGAFLLIPSAASLVSHASECFSATATCLEIWVFSNLKALAQPSDHLPVAFLIWRAPVCTGIQTSYLSPVLLLRLTSGILDLLSNVATQHPLCTHVPSH